MPEPFNYAIPGASEGILPSVQAALFNDQGLQANQAKLDDQARADAARKAAATIATTPNLDDSQFELLLQPIAQADPNAAVQLRRQREMKANLQAVAANPTPAAISRFAMLYPEQLDPIKKAWDMLDQQQREAVQRTNADVYALLSNGDTEGAKAVLDAHKAADQKAGLDTSSYSQLHDLIDTNPKGAAALAGMSLSTAMGHDKFPDAFKALGDQRRADQLQPATVQKTQAEADKATTEAQFAPAKAQSDLQTAEAQRQKTAADIAHQVNEDRIAQGRLQLDQDTLTTNTQLKLQELDQTGTKPDPASTQLMNQAAGESVDSQQLANRERDLAGQVRAAGLKAGPAARAAEAWKSAFGAQNPITQIRAEYVQLRNSQALKGRKDMPGQMSDADRNFLMQGFPDPNSASPEYLAHFLEVMARASEINAQLADRKAGWISKNGNLGTAKRDIDVGGTTVPAGTSFAQFIAQVGAAGNKSLPSGIKTLADRYGH